MWRRRLLCVLLAGGVARAAVVTGGAPDCPAIRSLLLEKGVSESALSATGAAGEVCTAAAASCCSRPWELGIRDVVHHDFRKQLLDSTDQVKNLLHQQVVAVQDTILKAVHHAKESTINRYNEDNHESSSVVQSAIPALFDKFMRYFQSQLSDPELEAAITTFFDDLFVVAYQDGAGLNETLSACLREKRHELRPFKQAPFRMKEKLLRTFGLAKFYLQSLYGGLEVLNTTTQFEYSESCYEALTRLSYCPLCLGMTEVKPCTGFCFNAMRGCMAPLSTLSQSWSSYVEVLRKLATSLQAGNNVETYLLKMYVNISEAMTFVWNNREELERAVAEACGPSPSTEPTRRRREVEMQYRSSGDLGGTLPALPQRQQHIDFESTDVQQLNTIMRAFNSDVEQHRSLFRSLPQNACNDLAYDSGPSECWNGESVGDYEKPLAGVGLDSQVFNPEVTVPQMSDPVLKEKADLLDQIQQGSNDKLAAMPPRDNQHWDDDDHYDHSGYDSDIYNSGDHELEYPIDYEDYDEYSGNSGDMIDPDHPDHQDGRDDEVTLPPSLHGEGDQDLEIPGEMDVVVPGVKEDPAPPAATTPPSKTQSAGAAAVVTGCWTLLAAALAAARL